MGIKGLTRYIYEHSEQYFEPFELHDSYLVIDGNCVTYCLYASYAKCNCVFGGDYDKFSRCVTTFFDELKKCNVIPLVIFDGAPEKKKLNTVISRRTQRILNAATFTPQSQRNNKKLFPSMACYVFRDVLKAKGIKYAATIYEADSAIAAVAKVLNCPVLSNDSDFYIFGSSYIPVTTFQQGLIKRKSYTDYAKACKIYRIENLLPNFNSQKMLLLPLFPMLLGNDYIKRSTFKNFLAHLAPRRNTSNGEEFLIEALLKWLRECTFDDALLSILRRTPKCKRQTIVNTMELIINHYLQLPTNVLESLGIPEEHYKQDTISISAEFKYADDINNLEYVDEALDVNGSDIGSENDDDHDEDNDHQDDSDDGTELDIHSLPEWFIKEHCSGKLPSYLLSVIVHRTYFCFMPIEDFTRPPTMLVCENILKVLFGLLIQPDQRQRRCVRYMTREKGTKLVYRQLRFNNNFIRTLPSLDCLRTILIDERREILNKTLKINTDFLNDIPSDWHLYIAAIIFWAEQQESISTIICHIYALLICLLFHVIDNNIGCYRNLETFHKKYNNLPTKNEAKCQEKTAMNNSIVDICKCIDKNDCLFAATFFIQNFHGDGKLFTRQSQFYVSVVHIFAQFQNCVKHITDLNALLGCPYEELLIGNLYNGTFLYNLVVNLKQQKNIESYIGTILQQSPSLLQLLNALVHKVMNTISAKMPYA